MVMSRSLRCVRLALRPLATVVQTFLKSRGKNGVRTWPGLRETITGTAIGVQAHGDPMSVKWITLRVLASRGDVRRR